MKTIFIIGASVSFAPFVFIIVLFVLKRILNITNYTPKILTLAIGAGLLLLWLAYYLLDGFWADSVC